MTRTGLPTAPLRMPKLSSPRGKRADVNFGIRFGIRDFFGSGMEGLGGTIMMNKGDERTGINHKDLMS